MLERLANFTFNWKLSLFTVLLLPLMLNLGFWQLAREQEKLSLQSIYAQRQSAPAQSLAELDRQADLQYVAVELLGEFDNAHSFLLDNKINAGRVGFEVISPFYTETGELLLLNRGWAPQGKYRTDFPEIDPVEGVVRLTGSVYMPLGQQVMLGDELVSQNWPRLIQSLDPEQLAEQLKGVGKERAVKLFPYSIRLAPNVPGVLQRNWPVISTSPEKHRAYAVQWFIMAGVLLLLYFYVSTGYLSNKLDS